MQRRRFIQLIAASSLTGACTTDAMLDGEKMRLTPSQTEGPFYPFDPIEERNDLLVPGHLGSRLELSGTVFDTFANPVPNAKVEIWQCDAQGIYLHPRQRGDESFDPKFKGFGSVSTNDDGQYQFTTIVPVPYAWRPPHIHTKIFLEGTEKLTSQIYLADERGNKKLKMALHTMGEETFQANFDFVIRT